MTASEWDSCAAPQTMLEWLSRSGVATDRKARLYSPREGLSFMVKTIVQRGRTLRSAEECYQWYDGRR